MTGGLNFHCYGRQQRKLETFAKLVARIAKRSKSKEAEYATAVFAHWPVTPPVLPNPYGQGIE